MDLSIKNNKKYFKSLSQSYHSKAFRWLSEEEKRVYMATRFPAITAVIRRILIQEVLPILKQGEPVGLLDMGAGPGTAALAFLEQFPEITRVDLLERDRGWQCFSEEYFAAFRKRAEIRWRVGDLKRKWEESSYDFAVASYVLGELENEDQKRLIERIWPCVNYLLLIEPGTPHGFSKIRSAREQLINLGGFPIAPCPAAHACPMTGSDWCHFAERLERSSLHRALKSGSLGYEDEKYSYLFIGKKELVSSKPRILRPPRSQSAGIELTLCTEHGKEIATISKRDRERYRLAKKARSGDRFE